MVIAKLSRVNHADVCILHEAILNQRLVSVRVYALVDRWEHAVLVTVLRLWVQTLRVNFRVHFRHISRETVADVLQSIVHLGRRDIVRAVFIDDAQL